MFNPSASRWSRAAARHPYGPASRARRPNPLCFHPATPERLTVRLGRLPHLAPLWAALGAVFTGEAAQ